MMRIVVTGATGFIGRHVVAELGKHPVEVIAVGRSESSSQVATPGKVRFVEFDLANASAETFSDLGSPDALIHLAWGGLPNYKSLHHIERELPVQYRFLSNMVKSGLSTMVVAGTCFEYGMQSGELDEGLEARPTNPYGFAKNTLRLQLEFLRSLHPFHLCWGRLFYLHGEGQASNSLLPQLERALANGDKIFNMSGGEQLRDYLPVDEVARFLSTMAMCGSDAGVVNICSGKPISVRRFVETLLDERGHAIELNLGVYPYPDYEPMAFWGNRSHLEAVMTEAGTRLAKVR